MTEAENLDPTAFSFGLREMVITAIFLVLLYMVWQLIGIVRLSRGRQTRGDEGVTSSLASAQSWKQAEEDSLESLLRKPASRPETRQIDDEVSLSQSTISASQLASKSSAQEGAPSPAVRETEPLRRGAFGNLQKNPYVQGVEQKLSIVREEMSEMRRELLSLQDKVSDGLTQSPIPAQIQANTSPVYSDAIRLALQGLDAVTISDRCGIPLGEASLVVALSGKKRQRA